MIYPQPLVHIGYHKTASTWLQEVIFSDENAGFISPWGSLAGEAVEQFIVTNPFVFSAESAWEAFEPGLQAAAQRKLVPVLSHEFLSGNPIDGMYWGKTVAERIHAVFPQARILILIREQKSMILSSYREYIKVGGAKTLPQFIGAEAREPGFGPICQLDHFRYHLLISYYQNLFGSDNILALPFELLKDQPEATISKICSFANTKNGSPKSLAPARNVGFKGATLEFRRQLNKFTKPYPFADRLSWRISYKISTVFDSLIPQNFHKTAERRYQQFIADYVGDTFRKSNQQTSELTGINLSNLGYDC